MMELPIMWGSSMAVDVQAYLKIGPLRVVVPISVRRGSSLGVWAHAGGAGARVGAVRPCASGGPTPHAAHRHTPCRPRLPGQIAPGASRNHRPTPTHAHARHPLPVHHTHTPPPLRRPPSPQVSDVQYKLLVRLTLLLVDTIPCIGGATLALLDTPHIDFKLKVLARTLGGPRGSAAPHPPLPVCLRAGGGARSWGWGGGVCGGRGRIERLFHPPLPPSLPLSPPRAPST